uniref:Uncharacterized protein n=1 Tax=Pygocentrus nattereri TaxID=42514 RepID=A0AAR2LKV2_PYGNA
EHARSWECRKRSHDRHCQKNPRFNVSSTEHSPNPRCALHANGRGHGNHECTSTTTCVSGPRKTLHTFTITAPYAEGWSSTSTWRLHRQGPVHKAMETSASSCKPVLGSLES